MWELIANSFLSTIPVFVFFAIGYRLRSQGSLAPEHDGPIMQLAMDVGYPCLIFYNIMKYMVTEANPTVSSVSFSLQALACGFLELFVGVLVAWLVAKALRLRIGTGLRTFSLTAGVQNYAFYVIPIIQMLFSAPGDPTMGVLFVHNMGCEIFVWSLGVILVCGGATGLRLGMLLRGPLLAVCLSLALAWSGLGSYVAQPPVMKAAEMIGNVATPVCLILFGCSMYDLSRHFVWQAGLAAARRSPHQTHHGHPERHPQRRRSRHPRQALRRRARGRHTGLAGDDGRLLYHPADLAFARQPLGRAPLALSASESRSETRFFLAAAGGIVLAYRYSEYCHAEGEKHLF